VISPKEHEFVEGVARIVKKRSALITLNDDVREIEELAESAGHQIVFEIIQRRSRPEPSTFIGRGKIEELKDMLKDHPVDVLLINGDLRPAHHYILENTLKVECVDRVRLVLNIFTERANSRESKLQVERARLQYETPLLKEWIHSAKMGEHPGFLGGGEYAVDVYYDLTKKRMRKIDEELQELRQSNELRRAQRKKKGFHLVSLAGYTNAGKSSLLKAMTGANVLIEDRMFSTLSTTTRRLERTGKTILLTDTIGFFNDLPHFVIEAFKNTIDDIFSSDLVLLVIDCSEPLEEIERKLATSMEILFPEMPSQKVILVLNKADLVKGKIDLGWYRERIEVHRTYIISAATGNGLDELEMFIVSFFSHPLTFDITMPQTGSTESFIHWMRQVSEIESVEYGNDVRILGSCKDDESTHILTEVEKLKGRIEMRAR